jgi:hypothetical protein
MVDECSSFGSRELGDGRVAIYEDGRTFGVIVVSSWRMDASSRPTVSQGKTDSTRLCRESPDTL